MSPTNLDSTCLGDLLGGALEDHPRALELLRSKFGAFIRSLDPLPRWAKSFLEAFEHSDPSDAQDQAWETATVRMFQAFERIQPFSLSELVRPDREGRLSPGTRAVLFARLCGPNPNWEAAMAIPMATACPVSAALNRLLRHGEGTRRARHRWAAARGWLEPLGFGELVIEEAREISEEPEESVAALKSLELLVHDPILDGEHERGKVAGLRARWHLYLARLLSELERKVEYEEHLSGYSKWGGIAEPRAELIASAYEHYAEVSLAQGKGGKIEARRLLALALAALPDKRSDLTSRRHEILGLLDGLGEGPGL